MPKKIELSLLGEADGPSRLLTVEDDARVATLRTILSQATGVSPEKLKLVALKGRAMTSLGDNEKLPKDVKVGGVPSLDSVGEEKSAGPQAIVEQDDPPAQQSVLPDPRGFAPPPREPRQARPTAAKPKAVSKEEAAAKAAARKAREAARAEGKAPPVIAPAPAVAALPQAAAPAPPPARAEPKAAPAWAEPKAAPARVEPKAAPARTEPKAAPLGPPPEDFTLEAAFQLQEDMKSAFSSKEFQEGLGQLYWETKDLKIGERNKRYREHLLVVQKRVLPKYGFDGSPEGVRLMLDVFERLGYNANPSIDANTAVMQHLISLDNAGNALAAKWAEQAASALPKPSDEWKVIKAEVPQPAVSKPEVEAPLAEKAVAAVTGATSLEAKAAPRQQEQPAVLPQELLDTAMAAGWTPPAKEALIEMQKDLIEGYKDPAFQKQYRELPKGDAMAKAVLFWTVQGPVIGKYGFPGTPEGLAMSNAVFTKELNLDPEISRLNAELIHYSLDPEIQDKRAKAKAASKAPAFPAPVGRRVELLQHSTKENKEKPTTLLVEGDNAVGSVRQLVAEATSLELDSVRLLYKPVGSAPPVALDDRAKCPPKIQVSGPPHLVPGGALLTRRQAVQMQREFVARYKAAAFQDKLAALDSVPQPEQRQRLRDLCLTEQRQVLPKFGFDATAEGVLSMLLSFNLVGKSQSEETEIGRLNAELAEILDVGRAAKAKEPPDAEAVEPPPPAAAPAPPPKPVASEPLPKPIAPAAKSAMSWMSAMMVDDLDEETDEDAEEVFWTAPTTWAVAKAAQAPSVVPSPAPEIPPPAAVVSTAGFGAPAPANPLSSLSAPSVPAAKGPPKGDSVTRWKVVGGSKGGILVRRTADLLSPELGRLSTGAVVREKKLQNDRLHYERESGEGPDSGWVSLSLKGAPLVQPL